MTETNWHGHHFEEDVKSINIHLGPFTSVSDSLLSWMPQTVAHFTVTGACSACLWCLLPPRLTVSTYIHLEKSSKDTENYSQALIEATFYNLQIHNYIRVIRGTIQFFRILILYNIWMIFCLFSRLIVLQNWLLYFSDSLIAQVYKPLRENSNFTRHKCIFLAMTSNKN